MTGTVVLMTVTETPRSTDADATLVHSLVDELLTECNPASVDDITFRGAQYDKGLAWVSFPKDSGGIGVRPALQREIDRRVREAGAGAGTSRMFFGHFLVAPTIATHGSAWAKERFLRRIFTGEDAWCQLFSEPGAGSDLASLATRAVRDGDEWIVNGQKVWNTLAHLADLGMLVTRSDTEVPKHKGLTYFAVDMHAARPSSTRCTSPTFGSPTLIASATSARGGACRSPRSRTNASRSVVAGVAVVQSVGAEQSVRQCACTNTTVRPTRRSATN
jgi:alkylation response protein AidB-like acyl-CoA dehydrogenase